MYIAGFVIPVPREDNLSPSFASDERGGSRYICRWGRYPPESTISECIHSTKDCRPFSAHCDRPPSFLGQRDHESCDVHGSGSLGRFCEHRLSHQRRTLEVGSGGYSGHLEQRRRMAA